MGYESITDQLSTRSAPEVQKNKNETYHEAETFRSGRAVLSEVCYDSDDKTYQFWPDGFRGQGEGRAHR